MVVWREALIGNCFYFFSSYEGRHQKTQIIPLSTSFRRLSPMSLRCLHTTLAVVMRSDHGHFQPDTICRLLCRLLQAQPSRSRDTASIAGSTRLRWSLCASHETIFAILFLIHLIGMDPLSVCTGVITLLQATTATLSVCYNFKAALRNTPWSLTRIIDELKCLRDLLERLEGLGQTLYKDPAGEQEGEEGVLKISKISASNTNPLSICYRDLIYLDEKLKTSTYSGTTGLKRRAALQALGWQLKDREASECLERIERCKSTLTLIFAAKEA